VIERPDLVDLLRRLGLRTLGDFACLPAADVTARFGAEGLHFHRLARGEDPRPPDARRPPPDLVVTTALDPPAVTVEQAAFAARPLADALHERLAAVGLGCIRLAVEAETDHGQQHTRVWRHEGPLTPEAIADRVRWQLDGWLNQRGSAPRPRSGIAVLRLVPEEVVEHGGDQLGLWSATAGDVEAANRAGRALARVQGMLGQPAVLTAVLDGGRGPGERVRYVAWGDPREQPRTQAPWPGRVPEPSPALVPPVPVQARLCDAGGMPVTVNARYAVCGEPASLSIGQDPPRRELSWAGPWPAEERWWDARNARLRVRFQVATADGTGWLLMLEDDRWSVEAIYD
jgi:protein ImuB